MRLVFAVAVCVMGGPLPAQPQPKKQTVLKISPQTTRITQPLDDRGFVDYVRAIDEMASRGVTADNNFEVAFRSVLGPEEIPAGMRKEYYRRLGIPISRAGLFINYFAARKAAGRDSLLELYNRGFDAPWTADDVPDLASWLTTVDGNLDATVKGSQRTRYYTPYIAEEFSDSEEAFPRMISMLLPSVQGQREIARSLRIRANLRIGNGDLNAAWSDIQAIYRMSRFAGQGITLIEELVGIAVDNIAFDAAVDVLQSPKLTDAQAKRFFADLKRLTYLPSMAEKIDIGERFMGLDAVQTIATQPNLIKALKLISELAAVDQPSPDALVGDDSISGTTLIVFQKNDEQPAATTGINWNVTAELLNQWYDRLVKAAGQQDYQQRKAAFEQFEADIEKLAANISDSPAALLRILGGKPDDEVGRVVGEVLVALLMPAINAASHAEHAAAARLDVLRVAFAAEVYRCEKGVFPKDLGKLMPGHVARLPTDRFSGKPLRYKAMGQKLLLYSLGRNGTDDLGRGYDDVGENEQRGWDDIVIRISRD